MSCGMFRTLISRRSNVTESPHVEYAIDHSEAGLCEQVKTSCCRAESVLSYFIITIDLKCCRRKDTCAFSPTREVLSYRAFKRAWIDWAKDVPTRIYSQSTLARLKEHNVGNQRDKSCPFRYLGKEFRCGISCRFVHTDINLFLAR